MKTATTRKSPGDYHRIGVLLVVCSAILYAIAQLAGTKDFFGIFLINYCIAFIYGCLIIFSRRLRSGTEGLHNFLLCLVLDLISAYALNHMLPVFAASVPWLTWSLVIVGVAYTGLGYMKYLRTWQRPFVAFVLGAGFILFLYLAIFLLPLYPFAAVAGVFLGISLHSFVPLLFVIFTIKWLIETGREYRYVVAGFLTGVICALLFALVFCLQWSRVDRLAGRCYQRSLIADNTELPSWIKVAQRLPDNWLAEKYLKAGIVYTTADPSGNWQGWGMPPRGFDEVEQHDPLIVTATFFSGLPRISEAERIKILEAGFDARHKTQERLWSGDELTTQNVVTNVKLWPELRMAYTEKTITVGNNSAHDGIRTGNQEAIYTFHLPEGGVVSSLSLWIGGREEKGILTTKGKAQQAYRQVVGVESRDPSVVHWQEGNTVSVRVFPVGPGDSRIFKIGITAPLTYTEGQLRYDNIYFEGPDGNKAGEIVQLDWEGKTGPGIPAGFEQNGINRFVQERRYEKDWQLTFAAPEIRTGVFAFNGKSYTVAPYSPQRTAADIRMVYLDLNATWSPEEFETVCQAFKECQLYVFDDGLIPLNNSNREQVFKRLQDYRFSLFPLQEIEDPATALLVTKSERESPVIADLKDTEFGERLDRWLGKGGKLRLFNLGTTLSPYLKTLKEHRAFVYEQGNTDLLQRLADRHEFAADAETPDRVVIDDAGIAIDRSDSMHSATAPDHVMRLYAYNHLMQQLRQGLYTDHEADSLLVAEAQEAGVVSPLSSLVVLETAADYERFDIRQSRNSLQNASMKSKGAVPEPEEWALIIMAAVMLLLLYRKKYFSRLWIRS